MSSIAGTIENSSFGQRVFGPEPVQQILHAAVRALSRRRTGRALAGLSDHALRDIGVRRGEIDSIAECLAGGRPDATCVQRPRHNQAWL